MQSPAAVADGWSGQCVAAAAAAAAVSLLLQLLLLLLLLLLLICVIEGQGFLFESKDFVAANFLFCC